MENEAKVGIVYDKSPEPTDHLQKSEPNQVSEEVRPGIQYETGFEMEPFDVLRESVYGDDGIDSNVKLFELPSLIQKRFEDSLAFRGLNGLRKAVEFQTKLLETFPNIFDPPTRAKAESILREGSLISSEEEAKLFLQKANEFLSSLKPAKRK